MKPYHDPAEQIETEDIPPKESYKGPITRSRIKTLEQNDSGALSSFRGEQCHTHNLLQVPIAELAERWTELPQVSDESRSFFRVHTGYFSNIPKCIKAEFIASWACSQSSVVSSSQPYKLPCVLSKSKLIGATAYRGPRPTVTISVFMTLNNELHEHISRSGDESDAQPHQCLVPKHKIGTHLSIHRREEILSRLYPARDSNPGSVVWKHKMLSLGHRAST
ncbi:hypothetical protein TNCV_4641011 [Trichonephila clavipes]|nr:hypothetical protein TNCV_4641011 [Trichonephila clavipes]